MRVTLAELLAGVVKKDRLVVFERCGLCKGLGASKNSHATICTYCFGSGSLDGSDGEIDGTIDMSEPGMPLILIARFHNR